MSGYEEEHNVPRNEAKVSNRVDLSTFWSNIRQQDNSQNNTSTLPHPTQVSSIFRQLANTYQIQRGETEGVYTERTAETPFPHNPLPESEPMLDYMITTLMEGANHPPSHIAGVPDDFVANLDRVTKAELQRRAAAKDHDTCPICAVPFLEDEYPLVVRLPCHPQHIFDLECITPWLKLNVTCPLDRKELVKVESEEERMERLLGKGRARESGEDEEDDVDGLYG